ncbi:proton-conducting transporter transmembrane domain-containing protein [Tenggerimyces flavus]|uniref:Proton-conducting transporter membrane subunit n=1 Tax=Tenggerimyces flavus TaxID=1708749 RepID=A0ABV7YJV8_9ACTN|nr:proton-conducting transporter membrane subunit [Tenggerimyces flavus]MBM7789644.1 formate hydrogenlyase subunit 3/multisubunit Na+/H+ antiporter MnhD subunit [Tenggerimyces flavus]
MSIARLCLCAAVLLAGLAAAYAVVGLSRARSVVVGGLVALAGAAAVVCGGAAVLGGRLVVDLPWLLPLFGFRLDLDPLGGLFVAVAGGVVVVAGIYHVGYARGSGRTMQAVLPMFAVALWLVPAASTVATFLLCWELMAFTSLLLVLTEHRQRPAVARAGLWYAVLTHLGLVTILIGLTVFATHAGGSFDELRAVSGELSPAVRSVVFVLTFIGFASKAGIVPLHAWLPRAHPEAPSHVSALMSAAMVNLGAYGIVRVGFDLLGGGPVWWWLLVLALGAISAVYGILQAVVATDLKRMLGWSTTENLGLVLVGIGAAGIFVANGNEVVAGLALVAAFLHVVNHSAFKSVLFLSAGSVLHGTGVRDLDRLGGLRATMPTTTALFGAGALAASALPPGNAFVSEWLLLQSFVHGFSAGGMTSAITMTVAVAAVALTAGLGVATFVKAFGVGFLAKPRSAEAEDAVESPPTMLVGIGVMVAAIAVLSLAPGLLLPSLSGVASNLVGTDTNEVVSGVITVRLEYLVGSMSPLILAVGLLVGCVLVLVVLRAVGGRVRRNTRLWDCGAGPMTARMEYTATSFAEPLQRVFDDVLDPELDVDVTHVAESRYLVDSIEYRRRVPDRIEQRLYGPIVAMVRWWGTMGRRLANGSVHRYLAYGFGSLVVLLVVLAVTR